MTAMLVPLTVTIMSWTFGFWIGWHFGHRAGRREVHRVYGNYIEN